jgi:hypothetical protein
MSFDLEIEFVGLCMFVPALNGAALHVLMPSTCHGASPGVDCPGATPGVDEHVARLCFDTAYLQKRSPETSGITALVPVSRVELEIGGRASLTRALPKDVVPVDTAAKVFPDALTGEDRKMLLSARVNLTSGRYTTYERGACWTYPVDSHLDQRRLSNRLTWTVGREESDEDGLKLAFTPLFGGTGRDLTLYPINGKIVAALYHTTRDELPPCPASPLKPRKDDPANHFLAYYTLFERTTADPAPLPLFVGLSCDASAQGGSPYTCMLAQSPPGLPPL